MRLLGQKFGRLLIQSFDKMKNGKAYYNCLCECGKEVSVRGTLLVSGKTHSCGCLQKEVVKTRSKKYTIGDKYGRLTIIDEVYLHDNLARVCKCECGNTITTRWFPIFSCGNNWIRGGIKHSGSIRR